MAGSHSKKFLVVGVDFGTSYTGVAYLLSDDPDHTKIEVIREWPGVGRGRENETLFKAPTEISYESQPLRWGYMFRPGMRRYGWFKLLLDPVAGETAYNDSTLTTTVDSGNPYALLTIAPGKTAVDMCADYLKLVYQHTIDSLRRRMPNTFDATPIQFILTTPAMWNDTAQHATRVAAERAGFGSRASDWIEMVSEPEAAAAYSLKSVNVLQEGINGCWEVGNQIIICDAGGGTVDLITYEIEQISPYLKVVESVQPTGGLCGATALDRGFLRLLRRRLGAQAALLDERRASRGSTLMNNFETVKRGFGWSDREDDEYIEHGMGQTVVNDLMDIDDHTIKVTYHDLQAIFDPVIAKIIGLVSGQAAAARSARPTQPVSGVVLVGGFGESIYLYKKLKNWAQTQSPPPFISNPKDSWPAIVKGAVAHGLEGIVYRRKLQYHYGIRLSEKFDPAIHDQSHTYFDYFDNFTRCNDTVTWFAGMGEDAERDRRIKVPFNFTSTTTSEDLEVELVTCKYNEPLKSFRDARVLKLPKLPVSLGRLPSYAFETKNVGGFLGVGGTTLYRSSFDLVMVIESASRRFEIRHDGQLLRTEHFGSNISAI